MESSVFSKQMLIGVGTFMTSALLSALLVFFILVARKNAREKIFRQQSMEQAYRERSHSQQSAFSAAGYSAGFDQTEGRQIRKVTAYNRRSFRPEGDRRGPMLPTCDPLIDVWDLTRGRPLHNVHDPFTNSREWNSITSASSPPSEGQPAVVPFRESRLPTTPTFYTFDGRVSNSSINSGALTSAQISQIKPNQNGGIFYYNTQHSVESHASDQRRRSSGESSSHVHGRSRENSNGSIYTWRQRPTKYTKNSIAAKHVTPVPVHQHRPGEEQKKWTSWSGQEPVWREQVHASKRRSGSYDELEQRYYKKNGKDTSSAHDWLAHRGPIIKIDHANSSTYDGDVTLEGGTAAKRRTSNSSNTSTSLEEAEISTEWALESRAPFTRSTAHLDLPPAEDTREATVQLNEMYY